MTLNTSVVTNSTTNNAANSTESVTVTAKQESFNFALQFVSTFLLIIIIILALLGNALVIRAFAAFRKLRNLTNYFVISLAVTDILVAVFSMPVWVAYLLTGPQWKFSSWLLKIWQSMDIFCGVASISHLFLISIERYICISSPLTYHAIITIQKTGVAISAAWLFALTMVVIKLVISREATRAYQLVAFSLCFVGPVLGTSFAYLMIFRVSRTQAKKMVIQIGERTKKFCLPKEMKAAKTLGVVIGAFLLCWFPFFFLNIFIALCSTCTVGVEAVLVAKGLHFFNSVLNPIIYSLMNKQFKVAFKHLFQWSLYSLSDRRTHIRSSNLGRKGSLLSSRLSSLKRRSGKDKSNCTANNLSSSPV